MLLGTDVAFGAGSSWEIPPIVAGLSRIPQVPFKLMWEDVGDLLCGAWYISTNATDVPIIDIIEVPDAPSKTPH